MNFLGKGSWSVWNLFPPSQKTKKKSLKDKDLLNTLSALRAKRRRLGIWLATVLAWLPLLKTWMRYLSSKEIALYVWQSTRSDGYKTILDLVGARKRGKINVVNENILEDPPSISSRIMETPFIYPLFYSFRHRNPPFITRQVWWYFCPVRETFLYY